MDSDAVVIPNKSLPGVLWPGLPDPETNLLLSILFQLEQSQWWPPERIQRHQLMQLHQLVKHSARTVQHYWYNLRDHAALDSNQFTIERWRELPLLTRSEIQQAGADLNTAQLPEGHGPTEPTQTSGSTGTPVRLNASRVSSTYFHAHNLRHHLWFKRDFSLAAGSIRFDRGAGTKPPHGARTSGWASPLASGPMHELSIGASIEQQVAWIAANDIAYLMTYPTNLRALVEYAELQHISLPNLRQVISFGESVAADLGQRIRDVLDVDMVDTYSSMEADVIALQCPEHGRYHVQSESVLVEIVDAAGGPCAPGEIGRVVVTPLHNFATPLLRYDIGDYARVGEPCACGRGLPVLTEILGRVRNMYRAPDGQSYWPNFLVSRLRALAPAVQQVQLVQTKINTMNVSLVVAEALDKDAEKRIGEYLRECFHPRLECEFNYVDAIPRTAGGKYEDFQCALPPD